MTKLEKIHGPEDDYHGPGNGLSTENGDSWRAAVKKLNAAIDAFNGFGGGADTSAIVDLLQRMEAVEKAVADMKEVVDLARDFFNDEPDAQEPIPLVKREDDGTGFTVSQDENGVVQFQDTGSLNMGVAPGVPAGDALPEPFGTRETAGDHLGSAERSPEDGGYLGDLPIAPSSPPSGTSAPASDGTFDPTGSTFKIGDGGGTADGEPASPLAVLADREQAIQAEQEPVAANTLPPDVDPLQAVDDPSHPPSGETLDRADASAANNLRISPK